MADVNYVSAPCPVCGGNSQNYADKAQQKRVLGCKNCRGAGYVVRPATVEEAETHG